MSVFLKPGLYHIVERFTRKPGVCEDSEISSLSSCSMYYLPITPEKHFWNS